jgi:hypothetical protein
MLHLFLKFSKENIYILLNLVIFQQIDIFLEEEKRT